MLMKYFLPLIFILIISCAEKSVQEKSRFVLKGADIGVSFENTLTYDETFNPYVYRNFYNGGGVAIGDINNDGLEDIYFTGNLVDNKLFLNKGNWQFEDITMKAKVACPNVWSTGATFVDVNGDGLLDLYVCKSGKPGGENRHNELFINNGDLTFTESSKEYGLDITGLSVHSAFFDYDKDGDLDAYILNNSIRSVGAFDLIKDQREIPDSSGSGNRFMRNDDGRFIDVSQEVGIYSSKIGFGLGITLGDFNDDNYTDIFISNDFFERDYLYINNTKGAFNEQLEEFFTSTSMGAMGADLADLDNDLRTDLMVTEMLPQTDERQKTKTVFESWDKQQLAKKQGYYNQFSRNTLQRNLGDGTFIELGRQADVSATEWSWSALLFDMDNDGLKDIYITNGIYKDLLDRDYLTYEANDESIRNRINSSEKEVLKKLIDAMPSKAVSNAAFHNQGNFNFKNENRPWGLDQPSFSNGAAYADLDNDGDLDIVVNNVNMPSFVYENRTDTLTHRSVSLNLVDAEKSPVTAKAIITYGDQKKAYAENYNSRGFQSSVTNKIHFGVGNAQVIDSIYITWPDGTTTIKTQLSSNKTYTIVKEKGSDNKQIKFENYAEKLLIEETNPPFKFQHKENNYIDFNKERLLTQMYSNEGPALAANDINNDGIVDFFLGGAKNQSGRLYMSNGNTHNELLSPFINEINAEDTDAVFFDGDNDGDLDLYVCHGGRAYSQYSIDLNDTYYENRENTFVKSNDSPKFSKTISTSVVKPVDYDNDGDIDLFVGERYKTNIYGQPGSGYLLENDGKGNFTPATINVFENIGMITGASWVDINKDGWQDLIVAGEWMSLKVFINKQAKFIDASSSYNLDDTVGLWSSLKVVDIDNDGDQDMIAGNIGRNNFLSENMRMYVHDFDGNGFKEQIICKKGTDGYYPIIDKDELISQLPSLKKKLLYYKDYAKATMSSIFSEDILNQAYTVDLKMLNSVIFFNENNTFTAQILPDEVQYAPIYAITTEDINDDGHLDVFFGGNQYLVKPKFGPYDGSLGWGIYGPHSAETKQTDVFSLGIGGQIRKMKWIKHNNNKLLITAINNENTGFYRIKK